MKIRKLVIADLLLILGIFIIFSFLFSLEKAFMIMIPISVCIIEGTILIGLCIFIFSRFKGRYNKEKSLFIEEWNDTKEKVNRRYK